MLRKKESLLQRSSDSLRKRSLRLPTVHSVSPTAQIPPTWQIPAYPLPLPLDLAAGSPCTLCMWAMPSYPSGLAVSRVRPPQSPECSLQRLHRQLSGVRGAGSAHPASAPTSLLREPRVSEGLSLGLEWTCAQGLGSRAAHTSTACQTSHLLMRRVVP